MFLENCPDTNSSRAVIGIVAGLIILILAAAVVISLVLKTKPELVDRLKRKRGAEESEKKDEVGKDRTDEEQLIHTENTKKTENEVKAETQTENCDSVSQREPKATPNDVHKDGPREQKSGLNSSAVGAKITPETTDNTYKDSPV